MRQRDSKHLADQIINRNQGEPSYALLLGSGASVTSGVKTAEDMVREWQNLLYDRAQTEQPFPEWHVQQPWYGEGEYGKLFELMYALPSQRRIVVENLIEKALPSWGYAYLANLLEHNYFNVVFTTNFDDLLTEACYRYTDSTRPLVAAHDSSMRNLRVKSPRPKIVKLHGDFLYDSIKNTIDETSVIEDNTKDKIRQFAHEYGLVVVGYSGRDTSVMHVLQEILSSEDSFPNGIYWCTYGDRDELPPSLQVISEDYRVCFVQINGFDELMADLHEATGAGLPSGLSAPISFTRARASILIDADKSVLAHPVVEKDAGLVRNALAEVPEEIATTLPIEILAEIAEYQGNKQKAFGWWKQAYDADKTNELAAHRAMELLTDLGQVDELQKLVQEAPLGTNATYWHLLAGNNDDVIRIGNTELERDPYEWLSRINKAIALKRLLREEEKEAELAQLDQQLADGRLSKHSRLHALRSGIAALRGDRTRMLHFLGKALAAREITREDAWRFPVFEDYRNDTQFQSMTVPLAERSAMQLHMTVGPALPSSDSDTEDC